MARVLILFVVWCGLTGVAQARTDTGVPMQFLSVDKFVDLKISPDGEHYAVTVPLEGRTALSVLRRVDLKQTAHVVPEPGQHVAGFDWANAKQLVYSVALGDGPRAAPVPMPSLYLLPVDGGESRRLGKIPVYMLDPLRDDDDHILVSYWRDIGRAPVSRMDLRTGRIVMPRMKMPPIPSREYVVDNAGEVRFASGYEFNDTRSRLFLRQDGSWHAVNTERQSGEHIHVLGFSGDNRTAYFGVEQGNGPDGLQAFDLATRERRPLARHERVDVGRVLRSPLDDGVIAVEYWDGPPSLQVIEADDPFVRELEKIRRAFPGSYVTPTSYTRDGKTGVYRVSSDVNSGEFYRVDHASGEAVFLTARNDQHDPAAMAPMRTFRFKARDGLELQGFLTVPPGSDGKSVPLVLIPHGGPKGIFDTWGFDAETQMLASRGYAVMQVNFRGSGNQGRAFRESANGEWGARMQDDLTDATRWALAEGIAAPGRICIYGASYGGYAAMMGLVREPGLYACGIGSVGVYDLVQLQKEERDNFRSREYFATALGKVDLAAVSPARRAAEIRVPVLLGAGGRDRIAPPSHTQRMAEALEAAGVPVDHVVYEAEGHGYYKAANRLDWARRVLDLLDRTIGPGRGGDPAVGGAGQGGG